MKELTLAQIAEACGGTLIGGNEAKEYTVTGVEIDSRRNCNFAASFRT